MPAIGPFNDASVLAAGQGLVPDFAAQDLRRRAIAVQEGQLAAANAEAARIEARRQKFEGGLQAYINGGGGAEAYNRFTLENPDFAPQIKQAHEALDNAQRQSQLTRLSSLREALRNGNVALAKKAIDAEIAADIKANGVADDADLDIQAKLASGDEQQIRQAKGLTDAVLFPLLPPEKYANIVEEERKAEIAKKNGYTLAPGYIRFGENNEVLASAPFAPRVTALGPEQSLQVTQFGNTTQAAGPSGGAAPAAGTSGGGVPSGSLSGGVKRVNGWTPIGGENSEATVRNKLGILSKRTGFDIDAQLGFDQAPAVLDALGYTEGTKPNHRNIRNNNVGNIKDGDFAKSQPGYIGSDGTYARFATPEAGRAAGIQLVKNYMSRGQNTLRDIVLGQPVGGESASSAGGGTSGSAPGGVTTTQTATGKGKEAKIQDTKVVDGKAYVQIDGRWYPKKGP